jgi:UDP-N-acetylglucosamine:LPS N-acetylglucosamine transferase
LEELFDRLLEKPETLREWGIRAAKLAVPQAAERLLTEISNRLR